MKKPLFTIPATGWGTNWEAGAVSVIVLDEIKKSGAEREEIIRQQIRELGGNPDLPVADLAKIYEIFEYPDRIEVKLIEADRLAPRK